MNGKKKKGKAPFFCPPLVTTNRESRYYVQTIRTNNKQLMEIHIKWEGFFQ